MARFPRFAGVAVVVSTLVTLLAGCAATGERLGWGPRPERAPKPADILADLAANDAAIHSFKATGAALLSSPEFAAVRKFKHSRIYFRRPADLHIEGRKVGSAVFRLRCVGSEFLLEFPATRDEPYYRLEGEEFEGVDFSVSPSDIVREMFLPEAWGGLRRRHVRLIAYDETARTAELLVGPKRAPRRRITVIGPPWVVVRNELLDDEGKVLAITESGDYTVKDGIRFPMSINAYFPPEDTRMTLTMRTVFPNADLDDALFDIESAARELGLDLPAGGRKPAKP
ncbi:MAG: hypothetical protein GWP08_17990 [Nitrospiraceae bacterium]|nr:hypothetical protein [Nitrospiraceae bacterium]